MAERIWAALTPERVQLDPGGPPATVVIGVQNLAAEVDHLSIEVEGLDPTWHSGSGAILQLFPNERGQAQLILKVPSRSDVRSGTYPFTVKVRSRVVPSELATASGVLEVKPQHSYRFDVTPKRSLGRHGRFRATIKNSGTADVELQLQGKDPEALCRFRFRSEHLTVIPGAEVNVLFKVKPRRSGLVGDPKTFNLTITAASDGGAEAKSVTAQFVHQPRFRSWGPLVKLVLVLIVAVVLFTAFVGPGWLKTDVTDNFRNTVWRVFPAGIWPKNDQTGSPVFQEGFKAMHDAKPDLVGDPTDNIEHDYKGNGVQNSTNGTLFWLNATNTTYFLSKNGVYVLRPGGVVQLTEPR